MLDAEKVAAVGCVGTTAAEADFTGVARRKAQDIRLKQLIQVQLSMFFTTQKTPMAPAAAGEEDAIPGGNESRAGGHDQNVREPSAPSDETLSLDWKTALATALPGFENGMPPDSLRRHGLFPIAPDRVLEYLLAFGRRLEAIVHSMEAVDDGHRFRQAYLRKHWDTQMHHGDTFALDVVRERYLRPGTENLGSPEFPELLELYKDRVYDANIASAATTTARQRFGGALQRKDRDGDGGGSSRENFKTTRSGREAVAPRVTFGKDATKDCANIEAALYDTYDWGAKVLDLLTTSLTASIYSKYKAKIRLFVEFCIDEEGISPLDCTKSSCVHYLAWIAERGIIGAGSLQPYLSAIGTFLRHTGRDDAPAIGPTIGDSHEAGTSNPSAQD
eukprot:jgi/Tetstr1/437218/TSEL_025948.t1